MKSSPVELENGAARRLPALLVCWPIARTGFFLVLRRKLFWFVLALSAVLFLFYSSLIYLLGFIRSRTGRNDLADVARSFFLDNDFDTGAFYLDFMHRQGTIAIILLALAGSILIGHDYRLGGLTYYLSRRVGRLHYVAGKLLAIGMLVSMTTTLPAIVLFVEQGWMGASLKQPPSTESVPDEALPAELSPDTPILRAPREEATEPTFADPTLEFFWSHAYILPGIVAYGLVIWLVLGLLLFAMASWLKRTVPLVICWVAALIFLSTIAVTLEEVFDNRYFRLIDFWWNVRVVGSIYFGAVEADAQLEPEPIVWLAVAIVLGVCGLSVLAILPRMRDVKVVQ